MKVGILQIELAIDHARSLKDKRRVVRSLKDRVRRRFNVSFAEVAGLETWNRATLAAAAVSNDGGYVHGQLEALLALVSAQPDAAVLDWSLEVLDGVQIAAEGAGDEAGALWSPAERRERAGPQERPG